MVSAVPPSVSPGPGGLSGWLRDVKRSVSSVVDGLAVTLSWMFRRPMTIQYPDKLEKPIQEMLPEGYRGLLEVDVALCTGCLLCEKTCPISCIAIDVQKNPAGGRDLHGFEIDVARCMYCGLCSEACNTGAIAHTREFEATVSRLDDLRLQFVREPVPVAKAKAAEEITRAPLGSIVKSVLPGFGRRPGHLPWPSRPAPAATPGPAAPAPVATPAPAPVAEAPAPAVEAPVQKEPTP